jgi:hypothetical protein
MGLTQRSNISVSDGTLTVFLLLPKLRLGISTPEAPLQKDDVACNNFRCSIMETELQAIPSQAELRKEINLGQRDPDDSESAALRNDSMFASGSSRLGVKRKIKYLS